MKQVTRRALLGSLIGGATALSAGGAYAMTKSEDIVPILARAASDKQDTIGFRQGTLLAWDPSTGANTVLVAGQELTDLAVLASGTIAMAPGDTVALFRYHNTLMIMGAIRNADTGALQTRAAQVSTFGTTTSQSYTDLASPGPVLEDVYIGRSRQALVTVRAACGAADSDQALMNFAVSGASSIDPRPQSAAAVGAVGSGSVTKVQASIASVTLLTAADGLHTGLNTFTAKYSSGLGGKAEFADRVIVVQPF